VFSFNSKKKIGVVPSCRFREKRKNRLNSDALQLRKNDVTEPKAIGYSGNHVKQVKGQFQDFGNHFNQVVSEILN